MIVSQDGFVLTNYHVVQAAEAIEVALADGRKDSAKVVGADPDTDLAVLKLGSLRNLPTAVLAPDKGLRVGDVVLAIGNPFGVGQTTTQGIVSALGRNGLGLNTYEHFIQTDAAINPGNSGGALVDAQGSLVGINTAIYSESGGSMGIGFATPIDIARRVMDEIVKTGQVKRGWLGIEPQDITPELARAFQLERDAGGVIIAGVLRDGPAARAGLRVGDIVQSVNGKPMTSTNGLLAEIAQLPTGERARLGLLRGGKRSELEVVVGTRPGRPRRDGRGSDGSVVWTVRRGRSAAWRTRAGRACKASRRADVSSRAGRRAGCGPRSAPASWWRRGGCATARRSRCNSRRPAGPRLAAHAAGPRDHRVRRRGHAVGQPHGAGVQRLGQAQHRAAVGPVVVSAIEDAMDAGLRHAGNAGQLVLAFDAAPPHQGAQALLGT